MCEADKSVYDDKDDDDNDQGVGSGSVELGWMDLMTMMITMTTVMMMMTKIMMARAAEWGALSWVGGI